MAESVEEFFEDLVSDVGVAGNPRARQLRDNARDILSYVDGNTTAAVAAQALLSNMPKDTPSAHTAIDDILASIIVPGAEDRPELHQPFVELLAALRDLHATLGEAAPFPVKRLSVQYELNERRLRYGDPGPDPDPRLDWLRDSRRNSWTNANRFAALVHKAGLENLLLFGQHTLQMTLRRGDWRIVWYVGPPNTIDDVEALWGHAPAAAHWIAICGQDLYQKPEIKERWTRWVANLEWILEQRLPDGMRTICAKILEDMQRIQAEV